jgi:hypothetical protein
MDTFMLIGQTATFQGTNIFVLDPANLTSAWSTLPMFATSIAQQSLGFASSTEHAYIVKPSIPRG